MLRASHLAAILLFLAACGDSDGSHPIDGGGTDGGGTDGGGTDGGGIDGGGTDGGGVDGGGTDMGGPSCGTLRPDISGITGTEGLVIARDGTIYFSQSSHVGRMLPDGTTDLHYITLPPAAGTVWGIALDAANTHAYVGSPDTGIVYAVDLTMTPPAVTTLVMGAGGPNGLTMGPDGAVYFTDFGGGTVKRSDPAVGGATTVTTSTINQANGLVFDPADPNTLYVLSYADGRLYKLTLDVDHHETGRTTISMTGLGNPDGITIDDTGRFYLTNNSSGRVIRMNMDGSMAMTLMMGITSAANLEFGVGSLNCHDLYVTSGGVLRRIDTMTATSAAFPWH